MDIQSLHQTVIAGRSQQNCCETCKLRPLDDAGMRCENGHAAQRRRARSAAPAPGVAVGAAGGHRRGAVAAVNDEPR